MLSFPYSLLYLTVVADTPLRLSVSGASITVRPCALTSLNNHIALIEFDFIERYRDLGR